jgi:Na+/H+ antiporter NhaB
MNHYTETTETHSMTNRFLFWRSLAGKAGIGLLVGVLLLGITNPRQDAYTQYAAWKFKDNLCKQTPLPSTAQLTCATLSPLPYDWAARLLNGYTRRDNYFLFSVYTTEVFGLENRTIAIAGQFF